MRRGPSPPFQDAAGHGTARTCRRHARKAGHWSRTGPRNRPATGTAERRASALAKARMRDRQMLPRKCREALVEDVGRDDPVPLLFNELLDLRLFLDGFDHDRMETFQPTPCRAGASGHVDHQDVGQACQRAWIIDPATGNRGSQGDHRDQTARRENSDVSSQGIRSLASLLIGPARARAGIGHRGYRCSITDRPSTRC